MKYDVNLNDEHTVTNIYDLPGDSPVGHIFSFQFTSGEKVHTMCVEQEWPTPCIKCLFGDKDECPWDPDAGELLCEAYDCAFKSIDKVMESM